MLFELEPEQFYFAWLTGVFFISIKSIKRKKPIADFLNILNISEGQFEYKYKKTVSLDRFPKN